MQLAITRHELERRLSQLATLQRHLEAQERDYQLLHAQVQAFLERYMAQLGPLFLEHDALESQLYTALRLLCDAFKRNGLEAREPTPPQATTIPMLNQLPAAAPLPEQPAGGLDEVAPPSLKQLYRRAAMRLHPDLASSEAQRREREQQMMAVNDAYASQDRPRLEALLLAAGEERIKVSGSDRAAQLDWIQRAEARVQGRLRVVRAHRAALLTHRMHALWQAVVQAEAKGLDPLSVMAKRLRAQIAERRQELYIGQRLQPESVLAREFVRRSVERLASS